jgi:hypothetical protein
VKVQVLNDEVYSLDGRAAAIVLWLARQAEKLNGTTRVKIEFHCAGSTIQPNLASFEDCAPISVDK